MSESYGKLAKKTPRKIKTKKFAVDIFNTTKKNQFSDYLFKFLVIGQANTGKSCLLHHFIESKCK